jgi:menaquinone-dependent protoporphyrinogen oxidase
MKVLVAYATEYGSTREVAQKVGEVLESKGMDVDVSDVSDVRDVSSYDAAVVGAPVIGFRFLPPAKDFVVANKDALSQIPVAFFTLGMFMKKDTPRRRKWFIRRLKVVTKHVEPRDIGLFGGKTEKEDYRDWDKITAWAEGLFDKLKNKKGEA